MTKKKASLNYALGPWVALRLRLVTFLVIGLFLAIGWRAYALQVRQFEEYQKLAKRQHLKTLEIPAPRGPLLDRLGRELGVTAQAHSVFADPREIVDLAGTAAKLAKILDSDKKVVETKLASPRFFVWLKRHIPPQAADKIKELALPGITLTQEPRRFYPSKELAGPVLGFAGIDGKGLDGVELSLNEQLTGERARVAALRDASRGLIFSDGDIEAKTGGKVTLTIDRSIQYIAEKALAKVVKKNQAKAGVALVMDINNGAMLAIANSPNFDPNAPGNYVARGVRNRATTDAYEIGSIMKIFSVAAALDTNVISTNLLFDTEGGRYKVGRKLITDSHRDNWLTASEILKRSSNVGAAKIAQKLGREPLYEFLLKMGFGKRTGIELPGERKGVVHPTRTWGETGLAAVSFGYNITVTPLQVIAAFASVGSGGNYREPRLVQSIHSHEGDKVYELKTKPHRVMRKKTATDLVDALETVFARGKYGGTGKKLKLNGYRAAGKSGTAHKVNRQGGGYDEKAYLSSFAGIAPLPKPRIAVLVLVDEPTGDAHYGADVAGPAFTEITEETLRYLGLLDPDRAQNDEKSEEQIADAPKRLPKAIRRAKRNIRKQSPLKPPSKDHVWIPDFRGMGIAKVLEKAESANVEIRVEGTGRAVDQYPPPGWADKTTLCRVVFAPGGSEH